MKKESLCLDTSVPSAYYDKRAKERKGATIKFWKEVLPHYQVYVSEITVKELDDTKDENLRKNAEKKLKEKKIQDLKERERRRRLRR